ncbi:MAG: hypothetical protein M0T72_07755 [Candidatus Dormibacteraeota bacterium]|nr:hypothetical protein [Candidatus Dormibacteraeota bacterium]
MNFRRSRRALWTSFVGLSPHHGGPSYRVRPIKHNCVAVVSDGSAVLGLGNLGGYASLPVLEGKAILFKELAGVDAFPLGLATQDDDAIVQTVAAVAPVFGGINLEDIASPRCFEIESRLDALLDIPVFHDRDPPPPRRGGSPGSSARLRRQLLKDRGRSWSLAGHP